MCYTCWTFCQRLPQKADDTGAILGLIGSRIADWLEFTCIIMHINMHMSHLHRACLPEISTRRGSLGSSRTSRFSSGPAVRSQLKIEIRLKVPLSFERPLFQAPENSWSELADSKTEPIEKFSVFFGVKALRDYHLVSKLWNRFHRRFIR